MRIALFQPDIPQNSGAIMRMAVCLGLEVDIIDPAGFRLDDTALRRAGLDYLARATLHRFADWTSFLQQRIMAERQRLVLVSTKASVDYLNFRYQEADILLFGRETNGVPDHVHANADARVRIAMVRNERSLNVAMAAAMVAGEAIRQSKHMTL